MIELRDLTDSDEAVLFQWRGEPEVDRWMSDAAFPSREAHAAWFQALRSDPDMRGWMIVRAGEPSGLLTLTGLLSHHRRAGWNWFLGSAEARGRGVGRAAQVLGLDRAFGELGLHKVFAEVMADNDARRICGLSPIYYLLSLLGPSRGKLLKYSQWADRAGQGSVTYAGVIFDS